MKKVWIGILSICLLLSCLATPFTVAARPVNGGQEAEEPILAYGCDLSFWNVGGYDPDYSLVDFKKMKADGCDFVILRFGFEGTAYRVDQMDTAFLTLYEAAKEAGLDVGAYFYALATTYEGAAQDAQWCIDLFEQYDLSFEYPIYYDVEDPGNGADRPGHDALTVEETTALCLGWAQTLEAAGYYPGVYGDYELMTKLLPSYTSVYDVWYAYVAYVEGTPEFIPEEMPQPAMGGLWQYSWKGSFDGVSDVIDVDVAYKNYPLIMRKNGYNNVDPVWEQESSLMPYPEAFTLNAYNAAGEGLIPTYHEDGRVTLTSNVTSSWAWPSAYLSCYQTVDLKRTPLLSLEKSGTSHCNAVLTFEGEDGAAHTVTLADMANEPNGEFGSGDRTILVNVAHHLRRKGLYPADGVLKLYGITYYVMGAKGTGTTLEACGFVGAPIPTELRSPVYTVGETMVSGIKAGLTAAELFLGFDASEFLSVYTAEGAPLSETDPIASGMTLSIEFQGIALKTFTLSLIGDLNGDGEASTVDARRVLGSMLGSYTLNEWESLSADFNADGNVETADVRDLLRELIV